MSKFGKKFFGSGNKASNWVQGKGWFSRLTNPFGQAYKYGKNIYNGVRRGRAMVNYGKYLGGGSRSIPVSSASSYGSSVYGPTGSIVGRY